MFYTDKIKQPGFFRLGGAWDERRNRDDKRVVFTNGIFDLLHIGHVSLLERAAEYGDILIVGVNSDLSTARLKGPYRPIIPAEQRRAMVASLGCVRYVTSLEDDDPRELIRLIRPEVIAKGADWSISRMLGADDVGRWNGKAYAIDHPFREVTTSSIIAAVVERGQVCQES